MTCCAAGRVGIGFLFWSVLAGDTWRLLLFGLGVFLRVVFVLGVPYDVRVGGFFFLRVGWRDLAMARWGLE